jgi:hypothetical protein
MDIKEGKMLKLGDWSFNVFISDGGSLGFTVHEKGKDPSKHDVRCVDIYNDVRYVDIFVDENLKVVYG